MQRRLAAAVFGSVPNATVEDALRYFDNAARLKPNWIANEAWRGKALLKLGRRGEADQVRNSRVCVAGALRSTPHALQCLHRVEGLPGGDEHDAEALEELRQGLREAA